MADKVDLKPIEHLYLENLIGVDPDTKQPIDTAAITTVGHQAVAKVFEGTDVALTENGQLQMLVQGSDGKKQAISRPLHKEVAWLMMIKDADGAVGVETDAQGVKKLKIDSSKKDQNLDVDEVRYMFQAYFSKEEYEQLDPEAFLKGVDETIKKRWSIIFANMQKFDGDLNWKPTLDALDVYNDGRFMDDMRHANSVFNFSSLSKTVVNIGGFIPHNIGLKYAWGGKETWLPGDALAENSSKGRYADRKAAVAELRKVIEEGIKNREEWALTGNLDEAMKKLSSQHQEELTDEIPAQRIHKILTNPDEKKRAEELYNFAIGERPGFLGLAGGNTGGAFSGFPSSSWDNYFGWHRNTYFSRSVLAFLGNKQQLGNPTNDPKIAQENENIHRQAVETRKDILGDTGSFTNVVSVVLTNPLCGFGAWCEPTPYRTWGDEAKMDGVGRAIDFGVMMYTSFKGFQFLKEAWAYRRMAGMKGVWEVYKRESGFRPRFLGGKNGFRPIPANAMETAKTEAAAKLVSKGDEVPKGWLGKKWGGFKDKLFGGVKLSPAAQKRINATGHTGGKFIGALTDYVIVPLAVAKPVDEAFQAYYNPFETQHELELAPYPDILKPDPSVAAPAAPKK